MHLTYGYAIVQGVPRTGMIHVELCRDTISTLVPSVPNQLLGYECHVDVISMKINEHMICSRYINCSLP